MLTKPISYVTVAAEVYSRARPTDAAHPHLEKQECWLAEEQSVSKPIFTATVADDT